MTETITFDEFKTACVLRAAFDDFLVTTAGAIGDVEKTRVLFFARWMSLPEDARASCVLASLLTSPLCQDTPEVRAWRRINLLAEQVAVTEARVN